MTTESGISQIGPYWFGRPEQEIRAAVEARAESWEVIGAFRGRQFSRYQVSDKGRTQGPGDFLALRDNGGGYMLTDIRDDDGKKLTCSVQTLVMAKFDPRCATGMPPGMEVRHGPAGPAANWWPENLDIGTKKQNAADKPEPGGGPQFPCRNAPGGCPNLVIHEGRRCLDCVKAVGRDVAARRSAGESLEDLAAEYGNTPDWLHRLSVDHGGYQPGKPGARLVTAKDFNEAARALSVPLHDLCRCGHCPASQPRRPWWHRVTVTLRARPADPSPAVTTSDGDGL